MTKQVLSLSEAATYCNYKKSYLYQLTSKRKIPFYKPRNGKIFFKIDELDEWLLRGRSASEDELERSARNFK